MQRTQAGAFPVVGRFKGFKISRLLVLRKVIQYQTIGAVTFKTERYIMITKHFSRVRRNGTNYKPFNVT